MNIDELYALLGNYHVPKNFDALYIPATSKYGIKRLYFKLLTVPGSIHITVFFSDPEFEARRIFKKLRGEEE